MSWTWEEIEADWLVGSPLAARPETVVEAFNRVERTFSRDWIEALRSSVVGTERAGAGPTLYMVSMGLLIASLDGIFGADKLLELLKQGKHSAIAEVTAIHLVRAARPDVTVELFPEVQVGNRRRQPDFRARAGSGDWTYIEVTKPDVSEAQTRVETILGRIAGTVREMKLDFGLEVFLRREPKDTEVDFIVSRIPRFCCLEGMHTEELPADLGLLILNHDRPGFVQLKEHAGEENVPRLGHMTFIRGPDGACRHIAARMAYSDERATQFLRAEAKQLPKEYPGLIMVLMLGAPGGMRAWAPLLRKRLQPSIHTRVSGICLFESGGELTADGWVQILRTKLLQNPHARLPLPHWIVDVLSAYPPPHQEEAS
jgi:hypothetical protein